MFRCKIELAMLNQIKLQHTQFKKIIIALAWKLEFNSFGNQMIMDWFWSMKMLQTTLARAEYCRTRP